MAREYKDHFTLDGRVPVLPGVTKAKATHMKGLIEKTKQGDRIAAATLVEAVTTSDALFNFAHIVNVNFLPQYDEAPRTWSEIANVRQVTDFRPAVLYGLDPEWGDGVLGSGEPRHISPVVPEGTPYPYATFAGEEYAAGGVRKRGFKTGLTWEALINDAVAFVQQLPQNMLQVALDTEEYEVYSALIALTPVGSQLQQGTNVDGVTVPANSRLSRSAIAQAITQLKNREVNGRRIQVNGGFNLIVAVGQKEVAEFYINNLRLSEVQDGALTLSVNGYNPLAGITVVESEYVTGTNWYLIPKKGTTRRPVLELGKLTGHEAPELRISNVTGTYVGGGTVSPYEGSFDTDQIDFRVRQVLRGLNWSSDHIVWSTGVADPTP